MTALITALDNYTPRQLGENGHVEYGWSNSIKEKILQFSFQCTRTDEDGVKSLKNVLVDMLDCLSKQKLGGLFVDETKAYLSILYRMIGHTRDIIDGKGECTLTYMMIHTWYSYFPELSLFALKCLVDHGDKKIHQYGSWKDIKYFCDYCKSNGSPINHPLIQYSISLITDQLKKDYVSFLSQSTDVSLAAKWAPREKSAYNWIYTSLATYYFSEFIVTAKLNTPSYSKAVLKCKTEFRKVLSVLNKYIDTLQIKQCSKTWAKIDFNKVTSVSLSKQKKSLLNITKNGEVRYRYNEDRIACAVNFQTHIDKAVKGEVYMKGKRVSMCDFTKQALDILKNPDQPGIDLEINLLNAQWNDNSSQNAGVGNMIAMVDVSGSMEGDPLYAAIGLGIRIAEKSLLGKRVMTFSASPTWVNLDTSPDFVSQVKTLSKAEWGYNTNLQSALDMILDSIIETKMDPKDVKNMVLVILSDMQIDAADKCDTNILYDMIRLKYADAGIRLHGTPYDPPHLLFWNLRSTTGCPSLSNQVNVSMMSGFSPVLLNLFCDKGVDALESYTPWSGLKECLDNERYTILRSKFDEVY